MRHFYFSIFVILLIVNQGCKPAINSVNTQADNAKLVPAIITEKVFDDPDDPAIYIHPTHVDSSFILGTDKHSNNGGIYVFDLKGKIDRSRTKTGMKRVNNIDIAYGLLLNGRKIDIAVATERDKNMIRIISLPSMNFIDGGGVDVFVKDTFRHPMGVALYTRSSDGAIFAIVGRKNGPLDGYLEQYLLIDNGKGNVTGKLVRSFGKFSGKKEIESICVDNELGFVYYSDEQYGIRKYYADPSKGNEELAIFGQKEFLEDNEGISIYKLDEKTGYIIVSDQSAGRFNIYPREGSKDNNNFHAKIASIPFSTISSDGSDVTSTALPGYPNGLFVAMSDDQTYQYYSWTEIAKRGGLKVK